jgi:membrane-associated PAP2 superfamily phosphatase
MALKDALSRHGDRVGMMYVWTFAALVFALSWDASGLDLAAAALFGGAAGFPWREHWFLTHVMHEGGRVTAWFVALLLCAGVWLPFGVLRRITLTRRFQLALSTLLAAGAVAALKTASATSCPWDLQAFGGVAHHVSHWAGWRVPDGGSGRCFPAGHASSGFAFVGGWFAFHRSAPRVAGLWLAASLSLGLLFGLGQQARGAHFMSHTLWTGLVCWAVAWGVDILWTPRVKKVFA